MSQILRVPRIGQKADLSHPINRDCIGWWPLTDNGGTISHEIINSNHGVNNTGASWKSSSIGNVIKFDGSSSSYIEFSQIDTTSDVTFTYWFKTDFSLLVQQQVFQFRIRINNSSYAIRNNNDTVVDHPFTLDDNKWYFLCITRKDAVFNSWVNTHKGPNSVDSIPESFNITRIGNNFSSPFCFIQNVRIFNRALTDNEIMDLYQDPWVGLEEPSTTKYFLPLSTSPVNRTYVSVRNKLSIYGNGKLTLRV